MAKKVLTGHIVSDKMQKTVVVEVVRKVRHPLYNKSLKFSKKYKADTNGMEVVYGDMVRIEETRPISKDKYFKVIAKLTETGEPLKNAAKSSTKNEVKSSVAIKKAPRQTRSKTRTKKGGGK